MAAPVRTHTKYDRRDWTDIGFSAEATGNHIDGGPPVTVDFTAYRMTIIEENGSFEWQKRDAQLEPTRADSLADALIFLRGCVKWDGCSDWWLGEHEAGNMHFCSRDDLARVSSLLERLWDWADEVLPPD